jgi:CDP-diacylglycerol--glycerol-3-phosphate 3-phosphatidyltransferase
MRPRHEAFWNASNAVTVGRIAASPLLLFYPFFPGEVAAWIFGMGFLAVSLTDLLDGYLARRYGTVTRIGKLLDPLADKVLVMTSLVLLVGVDDRIPLWGVPLVVLILGREMAITGLRAMASAEGVVLAAAPLGKWKTGLQTASITCLLVHYPLLALPIHEIGMALLVIATVVALWSGYDYFARYLRSRPS